mgnify:CR=1 FL=1
MIFTFLGCRRSACSLCARASPRNSSDTSCVAPEAVTSWWAWPATRAFLLTWQRDARVALLSRTRTIWSPLAFLIRPVAVAHSCQSQRISSARAAMDWNSSTSWLEWRACWNRFVWVASSSSFYLSYYSYINICES